MTGRATRVLGIDTSLRSTGLGVVESTGNRLRAVRFDTVKSPARAPLSRCLQRLGAEIRTLIEQTAPDAAAVEGVFFCKNVKTAVVLGEARGAAIAACADREIPVYEYAPRRVKQAVVGFGSADKKQVRAMVATLLALPEEPQEDAADALAVAICHLHNLPGHGLLMPEPI